MRYLALAIATVGAAIWTFLVFTYGTATAEGSSQLAVTVAVSFVVWLAAFRMGTDWADHLG